MSLVKKEKGGEGEGRENLRYLSSKVTGSANVQSAKMP